MFKFQRRVIFFKNASNWSNIPFLLTTSYISKTNGRKPYYCCVVDWLIMTMIIIFLDFLTRSNLRCANTSESEGLVASSYSDNKLRLFRGWRLWHPSCSRDLETSSSTAESEASSLFVKREVTSRGGCFFITAQRGLHLVRCTGSERPSTWKWLWRM